MLLGALQALFLALALLEKRKRKSPANRILAALMFLTALRLVNAALFYSFSGSRPLSLGWTVPLILTYPPLLFLYVRALIDPAGRLRSLDALHFLPAVLLGCWLAVRNLSGFASHIGAKGEGIQELVINAAWLVQAAVYILLILRLRQGHIRSAAQVLSARNKIYLDWVRNLVLGFVLIAALTLLYVLHVTLRLPLPGTPSIMLHLSIAGIVLAWGYLGLRQPEVLAAVRPEHIQLDREREERRTTSAAPDDGQARRLLEYMDREKAYLSPELNLFDLARALGLPAYQLSALLNRKLGKTFFEFVNGYRVEEAQRRLLDPAGANLKILALALECGFNSKSSFNRIFKEMTGQTPSDFQRRGRPVG